MGQDRLNGQTSGLHLFAATPLAKVPGGGSGERVECGERVCGTWYGSSDTWTYSLFSNRIWWRGGREREEGGKEVREEGVVGGALVLGRGGWQGCLSASGTDRPGRILCLSPSLREASRGCFDTPYSLGVIWFQIASIAVRSCSATSSPVLIACSFFPTGQTALGPEDPSLLSQKATEKWIH